MKFDPTFRDMATLIDKLYGMTEKLAGHDEAVYRAGAVSIKLALDSLNHAAADLAEELFDRRMKDELAKKEGEEK